MTREVAADGEHVARRGGEPASLVPLDEGARRGDHAARRAGRRSDEQRPVVFELGDARERRVVDRPAPGLVARGAARALLVGACEDAFGLAGAAVEAMRVEQVEGGMIQVVALEGALPGGDGLLAERGGAVGPEPPDGARDLGRVARPGLALEERPVMDQRLALLPREPAVVPEVDGGGRDAVDGAAGEEERVQHSQEGAAREDAERADEVVDDAGAAVVPVVGEKLVRPRRLVGLEPALGALADDGLGMRVEDGAERLALGVAGGRETGYDVA